MADEWVLKTGVLTESLGVKLIVDMYADLALWLRQWKNISVQFVKIPKKNLQMTLDEDLPEGADWLYFGSDMSLFSTNRPPSSPRISLAIKDTSTYLLSWTPTKKTVPSLNFIAMQSKFIICLLKSWFIISTLMSFINCLLRFKTSWTLRGFVHTLIDNLWRNILLFFFEPFIRTARILSWRILLTVWLIAIFFIYIEMSSNLKSKFIETEYNLVESVADLPQDQYRDVAVLKNYAEERYIDKMAEVNDHYRELKKQMRRVTGAEFLGLLSWDLNATSKYLIVTEMNGKIHVKVLYTLTSKKPPRGLISFSEPLYSTFIVFAIAANASSRTVEIINSFCLLEMETKIMAKYFEMDFIFFGMKWTKPEETFEDLAFDDIKSIVDLFLFGCLLAGLIFVVETSFTLGRVSLKFFRRCRR